MKIFYCCNLNCITQVKRLVEAFLGVDNWRLFIALGVHAPTWFPVPTVNKCGETVTLHLKNSALLY